MKRTLRLIIIVCVVIGAMLAMCNKPIITGELTKQTVYLSLLNVLHNKSDDAEPMAMLIDDDSGDGVFVVRRICNDLGIKATFAVVPSRFKGNICDSLRQWQQEGYGIALHGYNHDRWQGWTAKEIVNDLTKSEQLLEKSGFKKDYQYVVPPHACNTCAIRKAVKEKGYKMVTGANVINPDMTVFQYGRYAFSNDTSDNEMQIIKETLLKAYREKSFVIFGTHSSVGNALFETKTKAVLKMAKDIGFKFI